MITRNDITGDELKSKTNSDKYRDGWERIFGKKSLGDNESGEAGMPRTSRMVNQQLAEDSQHLSDTSERPDRE